MSTVGAGHATALRSTDRNGYPTAGRDRHMVSRLSQAGFATMLFAGFLSVAGTEGLRTFALGWLTVGYLLALLGLADWVGPNRFREE